MSATQSDPNFEDLARMFTIPREPARLLIKTILDNLFHIETTGLENIPTEGGGLIICNHTDYMDVLVQGSFSSRKIMFLGKNELFNPGHEIEKMLFQEGSPLNLPGLNLAKIGIRQALEAYSFAQRSQLLEWGGHPVIRNYRGKGAKAAVQYYHDLEDYMVGLVKEGNFLSIFPEGTRTNTGVMNPFKALAAKIAIRAEVPIVPSGVQGAYQFTTLASFLSGKAFKQTIRYHVGQPVPPL